MYYHLIAANKAFCVLPLIAANDVNINSTITIVRYACAHCNSGRVTEMDLFKILFSWFVVLALATMQSDSISTNGEL